MTPRSPHQSRLILYLSESHSIRNLLSRISYLFRIRLDLCNINGNDSFSVSLYSWKAIVKPLDDISLPIDVVSEEKKAVGFFCTVPYDLSLQKFDAENQGGIDNMPESGNESHKLSESGGGMSVLGTERASDLSDSA